MKVWPQSLTLLGLSLLLLWLAFPSSEYSSPVTDAQTVPSGVPSRESGFAGFRESGGDVGPEDIAADSPTAEHGLRGEHQTVLRSWEGILDPSLETLIRQFETGELTQFSIPTFDGESVVVEIRQTRVSRSGALTLSGGIPGAPGSLVSLASFDQAEAGGIVIPTRQQTFEIRPLPNGGISFREINVHALGECALCLAATPADTPLPPIPSTPPLLQP